MLRFLVFVALLFTILLVVSSKKNPRVIPLHDHRLDIRYCMDHILFPKFFKTFCPGKGERWLKSRAIVHKHDASPVLKQDAANSFVKNVGVLSGNGSSSKVVVREDFYNAYREECCHKGCRLEEALEFCNTLT